MPTMFRWAFCYGTYRWCRNNKEYNSKNGSKVWTISFAKSLTDFMVSKGSIAIEGVSLTLVYVKNTEFTVALIPHTLSNTTLGHKKQEIK